MSHQLLLIGGGHAHVAVLDEFARKPPRDTDITVVSLSEEVLYSGMLPGLIAGHYAREECMIALSALAERANATFLPARVNSLDLVQRVAYTQQGQPLPFDVVSIDIGSSVDDDSIRGAREHAIRLRPLEQFVEAWQRVEARFSAAPQPGTIAVVGGGAGGVELLLAMAHRARTLPLQIKLQLITGKPKLLPNLPLGARKRIAKRLPTQGIRVIEDNVVEIGAGRITLARAGDLATDAAILVTGASPASWPRSAGLQCDSRGFIAVDTHLQSQSHPFVFAAGDCASIQGHWLPKSGVHSLREAKPLAENLRRFIAGEPLQRFTPHKRALYLISAGAKDAVGTWGPFSFEGERVWRWKDRIDRGFVTRFNLGEPLR